MGDTQATSVHQLSSFFEHLTLPALTSLEIRCGPLPDYCPITPSLLELIQRSKASISVLTLDGSAVNDEHLVSLLRLLPGLKSLTLYGMRTLDKVLSSLTFTGTNGLKDDSCPRLEYISLQQVKEMSVSLFSDCMLSRWWGPSKSKGNCDIFERPLKEVFVYNSVSYDEVPKAVHGLADEGLKLEIRSIVFDNE
ncbi:hypothetical protein SCHPADRAFT_908092 [Schizopora paradoxa]|uniref:RNI-like protein n=1 Tax=Schizopora paradoxa TaxID=27342 RepID=A0A0H2RI28_9AGAM|nr:hypothetical protein SCHPADRAFT_908092 [Schizopora paradoxa]